MSCKELLFCIFCGYIIVAGEGEFLFCPFKIEEKNYTGGNKVFLFILVKHTRKEEKYADSICKRRNSRKF